MTRSPDDPIPTDEILESLDLSRAEPGLGYLQALFARFNARVLFESASKILRQEAIADPREKPRWPEVFWREHLDAGAGGTCFSRVAAFETLLKTLGFSARKVLGRVERDFDHAALLLEQRGERLLCDVGFPLPELLPARECRIESALADLEVTTTTRGFRVEMTGGVPEGPRSLEIFESPVTEEAFRLRWEESFRTGSRFLSGVVLRRQEAARVVSYARGEIRVEDRYSRLTVPTPTPRGGMLSQIFEIRREMLENALRLAGDPDATEQTGRLTAYLETPAEPEGAFLAIAHPEGYRKLLEGVAEVSIPEASPEGWRLRLTAPGQGDGLAEEVERVEKRRVLHVRRVSPGAKFESEFRVEVHSGRTYLVREALFDSPREDLLRNDSMRGRLAGTLAVDLLAWARRIG